MVIFPTPQFQRRTDFKSILVASYSRISIPPDEKKRSAVWQNTFVQSCHLQQQRFAALYFVVSEYHGKSKEMITASVFRITSADNSIIQQKTCKAKLYRFFGTPEGTRTPDLLVRSGEFPLSYLFIKCEKSWYIKAFRISTFRSLS